MSRTSAVSSPTAAIGQAARPLLLRGVWQLGASWAFALGYGALVSIVTVVTLGQCSRRLSPCLLRLWGRTMLRIAGVTFEVEGAEHLAADNMKIATFNHGSMLDAFLIPVIMPRGSVAAVKAEVLWYPVVNLALYLFGFAFIDRRSTARARRTMARTARRMARDRLTVFIAPEGTRTLDGRLNPFKKGAFHLAMATGAPIVPVVIDGAFALHPPGRFTTTPGHVRIRVLPPRASLDLVPETIVDEAAALRAVYADALAPSPARAA